MESKREFERLVAFGANYQYIKKQITADSSLSRYNYHSFIDRAAKWNYRAFGFGRVSLYAYLEHIKKDKNGRLYNTDVKLWYKIIKEVFQRDNYTCSYCGKEGGKLECDHIIPYSKGGTNELENLTTACRKCNRQKKDKSVEEFKEWRENSL